MAGWMTYRHLPVHRDQLWVQRSIKIMGSPYFYINNRIIGLIVHGVRILAVG